MLGNLVLRPHCDVMAVLQSLPFLVTPHLYHLRLCPTQSSRYFLPSFAVERFSAWILSPLLMSPTHSVSLLLSAAHRSPSLCTPGSTAAVIPQPHPDVLIPNSSCTEVYLPFSPMTELELDYKSKPNTCFLFQRHNHRPQVRYFARQPYSIFSVFFT